MNFAPLQIDTKYDLDFFEKRYIEEYFYDKQDYVTDEDIEKYWIEKNGTCPTCKTALRKGDMVILDATNYVCLKGHWFRRFHRDTERKLHKI